MITHTKISFLSWLVLLFVWIPKNPAAFNTRTKSALVEVSQAKSYQEEGSHPVSDSLRKIQYRTKQIKNKIKKLQFYFFTVLIFILYYPYVASIFEKRLIAENLL